jgi:hypothetical protein
MFRATFQEGYMYVCLEDLEVNIDVANLMLTIWIYPIFSGNQHVKVRNELYKTVGFSNIIHVTKIVKQNFLRLPRILLNISRVI